VWSNSLWEKANPIPFLCPWALDEPLSPWWVFYSWSLAPRRLEVAWKLSNRLWKLQEVCITLTCLVETLHLLPWWLVWEEWI
jgi:hypothetical protein